MARVRELSKLVNARSAAPEVQREWSELVARGEQEWEANRADHMLADEGLRPLLLAAFLEAIRESYRVDVECLDDGEPVWVKEEDWHRMEAVRGIAFLLADDVLRRVTLGP